MHRLRPTRLLLTWLLLLAACLHAVAGAQPHGHCLVHGWAHAAAHTLQATEESPDDEPADADHRGCADCMAHAHAFALPASPSLPPSPLAVTVVPPSATSTPPRRAPDGWIFAARDPPLRS